VISYHQFIPVINHLLLEPFQLGSIIFDPPHLINLDSLKPSSKFDHVATSGRVIWYHEEPIEEFKLQSIIPYVDKHTLESIYSSSAHTKMTDLNITLLANSEKSNVKKEWVTGYKGNVLDWYFFFHGFLTLDWYRDFKFYNFEVKRSAKLFSCFNHLISEKRSYRLYLLAKLTEENLTQYGHISCPNLSNNTLKTELFNKNSLLDAKSKRCIYDHLLPNASPMILDKVNYNDSSASVSSYLIDSYWNIVTETVFYDQKLHLTEKIFKPIVTKRPFILVGAPGNLKYLKSYGFETFGKWIDESYDDIEDPVERINFIVGQVKKLSTLSTESLEQMHKEIEQICEFNHQHFFTNFKKILINELVDNFEICLKQYNVGRFSDRYQINFNIDFEEIKNKFLKFV
jgi:hypothetical protein